MAQSWENFYKQLDQQKKKTTTQDNTWEDFYSQLDSKKNLQNNKLGGASGSWEETSEPNFLQQTGNVIKSIGQRFIPETGVQIGGTIQGLAELPNQGDIVPSVDFQKKMREADIAQRKTAGQPIPSLFYYNTSSEWQRKLDDAWKLEKENTRSKKLDPITQPIIETGKKMIDTGLKKVEQIKKESNIKPGSVSEFVSNVGAGGLQLAPGMALTALTKNTAPMLGLSGVQSFGSTYGTERNQGVDPVNAFGSATGTAVINTAANVVPFNELLKPSALGTKVLKEIALQGGSNALAEIPTAIIDKMTADPKLTLGEAAQRVGMSGATGAVMGGAMGLGAGPFVGDVPKKTIKLKEKVPVNVQPQTEVPTIKLGENVTAKPTDQTGLISPIQRQERPVITEKINIDQPSRNEAVPVPKEPWQMTKQEFDNRTVKRIELPNTPRATADKPHGIYTTPSQYDSPHSHLGGDYFYWVKNPNVKTLNVSTRMHDADARGWTGSSAGVEAAYHFLGEKEVRRMYSDVSKKELVNELKSKYPKVEWDRYYDKNELIETYGALIAKENGYDAIWQPDNQVPQLSEYVGLTDKALTPIDSHKNSIKKALSEGKPVSPEVLKDYPDLVGKQEQKPISNADMGGYSSRPKSAIELPEIVEISKAINEGKVPHIREKLKGALGRFYPGQEGKINLRADIFAGPRLEEKAVKNRLGMDPAAEFNTFKQNAQTKYGQPGVKLIFKKSYDKTKGIYTFSVNQKDPTLAPKVLSHEIGHLADWLPDKTMGRGNILGRIGTLKNNMQTAIAELPAVNRMDIMKELKNLTQIWKPFNVGQDPKYTAYRHSSKELYADAVSVLFNEPTLLQKKAPKFYDSFFKLLDRKPDLKAVYEDIQTRLTNPEEVGTNRLAGVRKMFEDTNPLREEARKKAQKEPLSIADTIGKWMIDQDWPLLKKLNKGIKSGGSIADLASKAKWHIEESKYIASEAGQYMDDVSKAVLEPMYDGEISLEDIGAYMFGKRASTERSTLANPRGFDETASLKLLDDLQKDIGAEKFKKIEEVVNNYRKIHEELIDRAEKSGMYSPELIKVMRDNKNYAKFSVAHYLEEKVGGGVSAKVFQQVGTLSDIENPFIATVLQDVSMMRAAKMNTAKRAVVDFLNVGGYAQKAELGFDGQAMNPKPPKDPNQKVLTVLVDGKPESYYVDKDVMETFERNPIEASKVAEVISTLSSPIKQILVNKNPIWMARNIQRDFLGTIKNTSQVRFRDVPKLLGYYNQAVREVAKLVFKGETSPDIATMKKSYMLNPDRIYSNKDVSFENEIERMATEWQVNPKQDEQYRGVKGKLKAAWDYLDKFGKLSEMTGKVAGYKYLTQNSNLSQQEIGHIVRTRIGTPDARRRGWLHQITNNLAMFSNIGKEGMRTALEAVKDNPSRYIWKTMIINVIPKLVLAGAAVAGSEALKDRIAKIPEYDKQNYTIVPLATTEAGKAVYLRLPQDYEGQTWSAITWALTRGKLTGPKGALDIASQNNPYSLNPVLKSAADLYQYYIQGRNPMDTYRGRPVIPEKEFTAGGWPASRELLKAEAQNLGVSPLYSFGDTSDKSATGLESALKLPVLNVLGSFLRYSDRGEQEQIYEEKDREAQQKARLSLKLEDSIVKEVKTLKVMPTSKNIQSMYDKFKKVGLINPDAKLGTFRNQFFTYSAQAMTDPRIKTILRERSITGRKELLAKYQKQMKPAEYQKLESSLKEMGALGVNN